MDRGVFSSHPDTTYPKQRTTVSYQNPTLQTPSSQITPEQTREKTPLIRRLTTLRLRMSINIRLSMSVCVKTSCLDDNLVVRFISVFLGPCHWNAPTRPDKRCCRKILLVKVIKQTITKRGEGFLHHGRGILIRLMMERTWPCSHAFLHPACHPLSVGPI
jgi:hypothetical protein